MNKIITALILKLVTSIVTGPVMDHVKELVQQFNDPNLSGDYKKSAVKAKIAEIKGDVGATISGLSGNLINLAIEAAVAYIKARA